MQRKFPIWLKILAAISAVSVFSIAIYLTLAIKLFRDDKTALVYELNRSHVKTLTAEVNSDLKKISDKINLLTKGYDDQQWVEAIFQDDDLLVSYTLYAIQDNGKWKKQTIYSKTDYLSVYTKDNRYLDRLRKDIPIPFEQVLQDKTLILNSTLEDGAPLLTVAKTLQFAQQKLPYIAVVDLRLDYFINLITDRGLVEIAIINKQGDAIAHSDAKIISSRASLSENPLVQLALQSRSGLQLRSFQWKDENWIGAFDTVEIGDLKVISQVREIEAFRAARQLIIKSILFALLLITLSVFISQKLARTFTDPLYRLVDATEKLTRWEAPRVEVQSKDEIGSLANAFNSMATDLREQRAAIQKHNEELEEKVRERTAALEAQKRKAAEAQEILLRTTRLATLGELAGSAAHEVLNPLNNISIRLERMKNSNLRDEKEDISVFRDIISGWQNSFKAGGWQKLKSDLEKSASNNGTLLEEDLSNLAEIAKDSMNRLQKTDSDMDFLNQEMARIIRIINNMRSLARVGGERKKVSIQDPIGDTMAALSDLVEKHAIKIRQEIKCHHSVIADHDELVQVFSNLIRNSIQAIQQRQLEHTEQKISAEIDIHVSETDQQIQIRITDNGGGISSENVSKIFEPSFTTKRASEGTGMGLSISRRLIRAFSGDLILEDPGDGTGRGATFLVWLPIAKVNGHEKVG